jgi:tetratricopeptide (TPR) repeat protein
VLRSYARIMATTPEHELSPTSRALFKKAREALDIGNFGYTIQLLIPVLKESPNCLDARKLSRAAAMKEMAKKGKKGGGFSVAGTTLGMTGGGAIKKDPLAAMELAEKTLATDPTSSQGNMLLHEAAAKAGFPETAGFALETLVGANPKDTKILHTLGNFYLSIGDHEKAVQVYSRIAQINPADLDAIKKSKDASASSTMQKGGWQEAADKKTSFRDILADKDKAKSLEDQGKQVRTTAQISKQVEETYAQWAANESGVDVSKRMARLYEQWFEATMAEDGSVEEADEQLKQAVAFYAHTDQLLNGGDQNITRKVTDLQMRQKDRRIAVLKDWLDTVEDKTHPDVLPYVDEYEQLQRDKVEVTIGNAKRRVAENPTDLQLRYELGEALMGIGQFTEAIPELQRAQQNPNVRLKAMNLLGQCFVEKTMLDMAARTFEKGASEIVGMDSLKKDLTYRLALTLEKLGKKDEYLSRLKEIYEADYGYQDVAKRVESSYS